MAGGDAGAGRRSWRNLEPERLDGLAQVAHEQVRVGLRRGSYVLVAEEPLHPVDVHSGPEHPRGRGVPEILEADAAGLADRPQPHSAGRAITLRRIRLTACAARVVHGSLRDECPPMELVALVRAAGRHPRWRQPSAAAWPSRVDRHALQAAIERTEAEPAAPVAQDLLWYGACGSAEAARKRVAIREREVEMT